MVKSETLDRTFSALADPTRRDIVKRLTRGPASTTELARPYGISLPGVMKHIRVLEGARLVTTRKRGRTREILLTPRDLGYASRWIEGCREEWEARLDRLEAIIERKKGARRGL
jgi:DNA-binding transcriptional ArsR family regulator